jgi:hypothetical protein
MARQDESDDLEASRITALEASQASISVQDTEADEDEPILEHEIPVEECKGLPYFLCNFAICS